MGLPALLVRAKTSRQGEVDVCVFGEGPPSLAGCCVDVFRCAGTAVCELESLVASPSRRDAARSVIEVYFVWARRWGRALCHSVWNARSTRRSCSCDSRNGIAGRSGTVDQSDYLVEGARFEPVAEGFDDQGDRSRGALRVGLRRPGPISAAKQTGVSERVALQGVIRAGFVGFRRRRGGGRGRCVECRRGGRGCHRRWLGSG